mgnify:CR=1 FL=1
MFREKLGQLSNVTKFLGYVEIVLGILSFFTGIAGVISGIISIILGFKLLSVSKETKALLNFQDINETNAYEFYNSLTTYFDIQAVLIVVSLIAVLIGIFAAF